MHLERFPDDMLAVWRRARRYGLAVSPVNSVSHRDGSVWTLRQVLWLNDTLSRVHVASGDAATARRTGLATFHIRSSGKMQDKFAFHVCVITFSQRHWSEWAYYVIPVGAIPKTGELFLPLLPSAERGLKREVPWLIKYDWSSYRDAWHLIPSGVEASKPDSQ